MRYSILVLAPFVAAAYGQETTSTAAPTVGHGSSTRSRKGQFTDKQR